VKSEGSAHVPAVGRQLIEAGKFPPSLALSRSRLASMASSSVPHGASAAVLKPSDPVPNTAVPVKGPDFDQDLDLDGLLDSYKRIGFQAQSLGRAIEIVNKMVCVSLFQGCPEIISCVALVASRR
jgi:hypothetical protein